MTNAELILDIYNTYNERTREQILENLNIAIELGKIRRVPVDRYITLPAVTNRSKHSVMSWFNRPDKKIPLIDLCMIADYLNYNIYSFFNTKDNCDITKEDFLVSNEYYNSLHPPDSAEIFIKAYNLQLNTDKNIVLNNIEKYYGTSKQIVDHHLSIRQNKIRELCNCTRQTYYAWFNRSRTNVKIPLISLCQIAIGAEIDVFDLFIFDEDENDIIKDG